MDPKLAEIYGTNQTTDADLEKLAAAELATKLAGDEGSEEEPNVDGMTEEDLEAVAQDVLGANEEQGEEQEEEETEAGDDAQEKVAEADYLGRVMAHAYVQELGNIEKTAGVGREIKQLATKAKGAVERGAKAVGEYHGRGAQHLKAAVRSGKDSGFSGKERAMHAAKGAAHFLPHAAAATAAAVGAKKAFGGKGKKGKEKKSEAEVSAVDTLVLARANEILQASGIDPESLKPVEQEQEKTSADETYTPREVLAATVEQRAWELLGQYGVTPVEGDEQE